MDAAQAVPRGRQARAKRVPPFWFATQGAPFPIDVLPSGPGCTASHRQAWLTARRVTKTLAVMTAIGRSDVADFVWAEVCWNTRAVMDYLGGVSQLREELLNWFEKSVVDVAQRELRIPGDEHFDWRARARVIDSLDTAFRMAQECLFLPIDRLYVQTNRIYPFPRALTESHVAYQNAYADWATDVRLQAACNGAQDMCLCHTLQEIRDDEWRARKNIFSCTMRGIIGAGGDHNPDGISGPRSTFHVVEI